MGNIHTVGPNEALVVSGACCSRAHKTFVSTGGWAWAWWLVTDVQSIKLEIMTLNPRCEKVETSEGVPVTVTGVAQCKVMVEKELLTTACEQFLGRSQKHIENVILQTLDGHLRAILGTLTIEAIFQDRDQFATLVREVASPDVGRMGIEIISFTIKDVFDNVNYLNSLGRTQTACVKRDADIGVAQAERDAGIREAECDKAKMDARFYADTKIADSKRELEVRQAIFDGEVNVTKAKSELAYQLQSAKMKQEIRAEEVQIDVVERRKLIEIEEQENLVQEKVLHATVKLPAEAEGYKVETLADGRRTQTVELARASAQSTRLVGGAEAGAIEAVGKAEAERMRAKAAAFGKYGKAAVASMVLEVMPELAAEAAAPLSKIDEIVLLGDDATSSEVSRLLGSLPPAVNALTGVDITQAIGKLIKT